MTLFTEQAPLGHYHTANTPILCAEVWEIEEGVKNWIWGYGRWDEKGRGREQSVRVRPDMGGGIWVERAPRPGVLLAQRWGVQEWGRTCRHTAGTLGCSGLEEVETQQWRTETWKSGPGVRMPGSRVGRDQGEGTLGIRRCAEGDWGLQGEEGTALLQEDVDMSQGGGRSLLSPGGGKHCKV